MRKGPGSTFSLRCIFVSTRLRYHDEKSEKSEKYADRKVKASTAQENESCTRTYRLKQQNYVSKLTKKHQRLLYILQTSNANLRK